MPLGASLGLLNSAKIFYRTPYLEASGAMRNLLATKPILARAIRFSQHSPERL